MNHDRLGTVRRGEVWSGEFERGTARHGAVRRGAAWRVRLGVDVLAGYGTAWPGVDEQARQAQVGRIVECAARNGKAGEERNGGAVPGRAWLVPEWRAWTG